MTSNRVIDMAERRSQLAFAAAKRREDLARQRYNEDLAKRPNYPDGTPRRQFDELDSVAQWSWGRP